MLPVRFAAVPIRVDVPAGGLSRWFGTWVWSAPSEPNSPGPATYAVTRLAGWTGAAVRVGIAIVAAVVGLIGLAPPALSAWVVPAVVLDCAWAGFFASVAVRRGLVSWLMAADVAVAVVLCLAMGRLAAREALPTGASWVAVVASMTLVVAHLAWQTAAAVTAGVAITAAFLVGFNVAAAGSDHGLSQMIIFAVQIAVTAVLMRLVRGAARAADVALVEYQEATRHAEVEEARRLAERAQNRDLHDTVLATLTIVGTGAVRDDSATLRVAAAADVSLIGRLADLPVRDDAMVRVDERVAVAVEALAGDVSVDSDVEPCTATAHVAEAFSAATAQALTNVARHAKVGSARLRLWTLDGRITAEVSDEGVGVDLDAIPGHRFGIREAILGRMRAVQGDARVESSSGAGTRVTMWWPQDE